MKIVGLSGADAHSAVSALLTIGAFSPVPTIKKIGVLPVFCYRMQSRCGHAPTGTGQGLSILTALAGTPHVESQTTSPDGILGKKPLILSSFQPLRVVIARRSYLRGEASARFRLDN